MSMPVATGEEFFHSGHASLFQDLLSPLTLELEHLSRVLRLAFFLHEGGGARLPGKRKPSKHFQSPRS